MLPWVRCALVFGGSGLIATLVLVEWQLATTNCSLSVTTLQAIFIGELILAAAAGFVTAFQEGPGARASMAGFGTAALTGLSGLFFIGQTLVHGWPASCYEELKGLGILFLLIVAVFAVPFEVAAGTIAGWSGGFLARLAERLT